MRRRGIIQQIRVGKSGRIWGDNPILSLSYTICRKEISSKF